MKTSKQINILQEMADRLKAGRKISYSKAIRELFNDNATLMNQNENFRKEIEDMTEDQRRIQTENKQLHKRIEVLRLAKKKRAKKE